MKSVMSHNFSQVPKAEIQRSTFDRSHGYKTTFDSGYLVPFYVDEALPGDTFNLRATAFLRLATPLKPLMDNMFLETFFFAVPYRLVWDNWQKFMGEREPNDTTEYEIPQYVTNAVAQGSLSDYFGIPLVDGLSVNALPFRAYSLIYNEWFRDQNLQPSITISKGDGPDVYTAGYALKRRGKRHDYFTSGIPWPQKDNGQEVLLPLGTTAPVIGLAQVSPPTYTQTTATTARMGGGENLNVGAGGDPGWENYSNINQASSPWIAQEDPNIPGYPGIRVDLNNATSAKINQVREAFQIQRMYERDARGGTRYTEIIRSHFGVTSPDARLQRPEYLGGGSSSINVHPVPQSSASGAYADTPQGNLGAYGTGGFSGHGFSKSFTEHCIIIGLLSVRADLTYQQGLNRMWSRKTRVEHYFPVLAHLGEQPILNKEIYAQGTAGGSADEGVFAYQERFGEYRYKPSLITGKFRSSDPQSLDVWHLSQDFGSLPTLNSTFIEENPPIDRVIAVTDEPQFLMDSYINLRCARPMPVFGVPGYIDHF